MVHVEAVGIVLGVTYWRMTKLFMGVLKTKTLAVYRCVVRPAAGES